MLEKISNRSSYLYNIQDDSVVREIDCREKVGRATYFFGDIAFNKKVTIQDDKLHFEVRNIALRIFAGFLAVTVFSLITVIGRILLAISSSQKLLNEFAQKLLKEGSQSLHSKKINKETQTTLELSSSNQIQIKPSQPILLKPVEVNLSFKDEIEERVTEPKLKPVKLDQKNEEEIYREAVDVKANLKPIQTVDGEAPRPSIQVGEDIGNIIKKNKEESKNNPIPQREIPIVDKLHQSLIGIVDNWVQKMELEEDQEEDDDDNPNWITSDYEPVLDDVSLKQNLFKQPPTASFNNDEKTPVTTPKLEERDQLALQQRRRSILGLSKQDDGDEENDV